MPDTKPKVMIIDNDLIALMATADRLQADGYRVLKVPSTHGLRAKLDYERPDILLIDVQMPQLAADDLLDHLHTAPEHPDLTIVLYSNLPPENLEEICKAKDLHGYFNKGLSPDLLSAFISKIFIS